MLYMHSRMPYTKNENFYHCSQSNKMWDGKLVRQVYKIARRFDEMYTKTHLKVRRIKRLVDLMRKCKNLIKLGKRLPL